MEILYIYILNRGYLTDTQRLKQFCLFGQFWVSSIFNCNLLKISVLDPIWLLRSKMCEKNFLGSQGGLGDALPGLPP